MWPLQKIPNRYARVSPETGCSFCDQDLLKRGGLCLPSIKQFTVANTTAQDRRRIARLCMLYKTLHNEAEITVQIYVQHQQLQRTRHSYPLKFTPLQATCDGYKFSVWPRTIRDWNSLHADIMQSNSIHCFQRALGAALMNEWNDFIYLYSCTLFFIMFIYLFI